jgi:hypothetical protein
MARSKAQPDRREVSGKHGAAAVAAPNAVLVRDGCAFRLTGIAKQSLHGLIDNKHDELGGIVLNVQA